MKLDLVSGYERGAKARQHTTGQLWRHFNYLQGCFPVAMFLQPGLAQLMNSQPWKRWLQSLFIKPGMEGDEGWQNRAA